MGYFSNEVWIFWIVEAIGWNQNRKRPSRDETSAWTGNVVPNESWRWKFAMDEKWTHGHDKSEQRYQWIAQENGSEKALPINLAFVECDKFVVILSNIFGSKGRKCDTIVLKN